jgi:hypothetical protein
VPRFFIHVRDGDHLIRDLKGTEADNLGIVRAETLAAAREFFASQIIVGEITDQRRFEIVDESGRTVAVIPFQDAVAPPALRLGLSASDDSAAALAPDRLRPLKS